jgi:hypothetical protein
MFVGHNDLRLTPERSERPTSHGLLWVASIENSLGHNVRGTSKVEPTYA